MKQQVLGVLEEFAVLAAIPRPSGHTEAVSDYLMGQLRGMGFSPRCDAAMNIVCDIPATSGLERRGRLALQAHTDMVCVGVEGYDPVRDPVEIRVRDGWLCSDGRSSLGADCGIGLAAAMYLLRAGMPHGPLRLLLTADEELGLAGAQKLRRDCLTGCDGLVNLDGFHFGRLLIGSAGGLRQTFRRMPEVFPAMLDRAFHIQLSGLRGGHSGDDIGLGRANGAQLMIWLLQSLGIPYELGGVFAGTAHNAIPAQAEAVVVIDGRDETSLRQDCAAFQEDLRSVYGETDPDIFLEISPAEKPEWVLTVDQRDDLLALAGLVPCGPWEQHPLCPDCVGSSGTLGRLYADSEQLEVLSFLRSYDEAQMDVRGDFLHTAAEGFGFEVQGQRYGSWPGVAQDPLTDLFLRKGEEMGIAMGKSAAHVGLETSVFHSMAPGMPMVSVGMELQDPHSVRERVRLDTIGPFVELLGAVVAEYGRTEIQDA